MNNNTEHPSEYDWDFLREWCLWYISIFFRFAEMFEPKAKEWFYTKSTERPIVWRNVKEVRNLSARYTVETITAQISEAVATREALPGDFINTVTSLREIEKLLKLPMTSDDTWDAIVQGGWG